MSRCIQKNHCLINAPVLDILHVDASMSGLGAVPYQEHLAILNYITTILLRYSVHQIEFLVLKWAVVDKFHDYMYGAKFTVRNDYNP